MAKLINRLTDLKVRKAGMGRHADGDGLYLQVRGPTAKSWLYRYSAGGKLRYMGLGAYPAVSLDLARRARDAFKRIRVNGQDPIDSRNQERLDAKVANASAVTFKAAALEYMAAKAPQWGNERHREQWIKTLKTHVEPVIGSMPVKAITTADIKRVLDPIWLRIPVTASRVRNRIELVLDYCSSLGYRKGDNPARWRGNLKDLFAAPSDVRPVEHHPSLPWEEIPTFMEKLRAKNTVAARGLEFVILTATRANEGLGARPEEVQTADRAWTVPKVRVKARKGKKRDHRVPLAPRALEILNGIPRRADNPHYFAGQGKGTHLSDSTLRVLLANMGYGHVTTHGFRSTFRTWASEQTRFQREVAEKAIAHLVGDETERSYDRGDLFEKRRQLMESWATYCTSKPVARGAAIIPIGAAVAGAV